MTFDDSYGVRPPGYRLPGGTGIGRVVLQVADLSRSLAYYQSVIGLSVIGEDRESAALGGHGSDRVLVELRERRGARPVPRRGRLGLFHVAILVPERAVLARVLRHLLALGIQPGMADHFVSEALYLSDPDGLGLEIYADRPRVIWRAEGRQLYMTTEPLDVHALLASDDGSWTGMPAGTLIGHVHLSVDDLDRASAFYAAALGFDKTVWTYPGALFMAADGYHHHLGTNTWSAGAPPATDEDARLVGWELVLPESADLSAVRDSLEKAGYRATPLAAGWRVLDPWAIGVDVRHPPS